MYGRSNGILQQYFRMIPVTATVIGIWLVSMLTGLLGLNFLNVLLPYNPVLFPNYITGFITYPLVMIVFSLTSLVNFVFAVVMMFQCGGDLERRWGSARFFLFLLGATISASLLWQLCMLFIPGDRTMAAPWLLIGAVVLAWAWLNPEQDVNIWGIIPVKAKWVGWGAILFIYVGYPLNTLGPNLLLPIEGFFALGGVGFALLFLKYMRTRGWIPRKAKSAKRKSRAVRLPSTSLWGRITRPYREWQRKRRAAYLQKTFKLDD